MYSKIPFVILAACVFIGCAKENLRKSQAVKVELNGNCESLTLIGERLSQFAKGELSDQQASDVWRCTNKAVRDFDRITGGDLPGGDYSPHAVRHFFEVYFLSDRPVSDELLSSIMEVKRVLVAGSTARITRGELAKLQELIEILRQASVELNPYAKTAFLGGEEAADEDLLAANEAFGAGIRRLGQWLTAQNQEYSFSHARALIRELQKWISKRGQDSDILADFDKAFEVVPALKQILLSGDVDGIKGADWLPLTQALGRAHYALLALKFSFKSNLIAGLNRGAIPQGIESFAEVLDSARKLHPNQEIPLAEWSEFFGRLEKTGWLKEDFTQAGLDNAFSWLVNRLLNGTPGKTQTALRREHLITLRKHLQNWRDIRAHVLTGLPAVATKAIVQKFAGVLQASVPSEWDKEGRLVFGGRAPTKWETEAQLNMIWPFIAINWIKESFAGEAAESLDESQMLAAGKEILPVLQKFGWLKSTKDTIGTKLLREADVFTSASNGNLVIEVSEATRYLAFVASGFRAAQVWLDEAKTVCPTKEAVCLRAAAANPSLDILTPMPGLRSFIRANPQKLFSSYSRAAEETILGQPAQGPIGTADLLQAWMIFQYVEAFDLRFDADRNQIINLQEGEEAFKLFGPFLDKMLTAKGFPADEIPAFFTFLLKFGDTPFTMFGGGVAYNYWKWHPNDWVLSADRQKLVDVLKQLSKL